MAQVSFEIPALAIAVLANYHGWTAQVRDPDTGEMVDNPITRIQYVKRFYLGRIREDFMQARIRALVEDARTQAANDVQTESDQIV